MFHSFYVNPERRDYLRFVWFENNDLRGSIVEFCMNVHLFVAVSSSAVANFCLHETAEAGRNQARNPPAPLQSYLFTNLPVIVLETLPLDDRAKDLKDLNL